MKCKISQDRCHDVVEGLEENDDGDDDRESDAHPHAPNTAL